MMMVVMMMAGWVRVDACIYMHTLLQPLRLKTPSYLKLVRPHPVVGLTCTPLA